MGSRFMFSWFKDVRGETSFPVFLSEILRALTFSFDIVVGEIVSFAELDVEATEFTPL
ncbi:MAG: hypothetical protein IPL42_17345 [Saprospiraceae bacterium]|nr:hypothetical protein [Saprospiraceae bacterium]